MNKLFRFINGIGRPVWILPSTVIAMYQEECGAWVVVCTNTMWTMSKGDFDRLLKVVDQFRASLEEDEGDWWKGVGTDTTEEEDDDEDDY